MKSVHEAIAIRAEAMHRFEDLCRFEDNTRLSLAVIVEDSLRVSHYPYVWAIGDISGTKGRDGRFLPMIAPVALRQGAWVAVQILRAVAGKELQSFKYRDKGSRATIGRHKAIVQVNNFKLVGALAWYVWLCLHLFYLLGGRNKIGTLADWAWNYLTFDRGNRHIMDSR